MNANEHLRKIMNSYYLLSDECWNDFVKIIRFRSCVKSEVLLHIGEVPRYFYFVHKGLVRAYILSSNDSVSEVNKNFFQEGRFPASVVASLEKTPSEICLETIEDSHIIEIDFLKYRELLDKYHDLKWYHINYLEKHWVREKEPLETAMLEGEAKRRYLDFINDNKDLVNRLPLYHIASRIGITPTQLSRIRKSINK